MGSVDERHLGIARLYAQAMLEVAEEQGATQSLAEELGDVIALSLSDEDFGRFLYSPVLDRDSRRETLERALRGRASDLLVDSLQVINKKGRLPLLEQMLAAYQEKYRELRGQIEVKVATAVALSDEQREDVRQRVSRYAGKEALIVEEVDPDLLGGLVIQIGNEKADMSIRRDLELLSSAYARRLSSEALGSGQFVTDSDSQESEDGREEE